MMDRKQDLAIELMMAFAETTGLSREGRPRRYLWTDAFAVCNFLGLAEETGEAKYRDLAVGLVEQVHQTLGRHREDDQRTGWISGLDEQTGRRHPTAGGLRIGKDLPERGPGEPMDQRQEWDRDGQYFHYLTKWMHALEQMAGAAGDAAYHRWATELALRAHEAFTDDDRGGKRMIWKMSIDLSRPLVGAMGQHDPLDDLITAIELQSSPAAGDGPDLTDVIVEAEAMCSRLRWATHDPLGIGGLLIDAARLAQMVARRGVERRDLLGRLLGEAQRSLAVFAGRFAADEAAEARLAFRELGLAIGVAAIDLARAEVAGDGDEVSAAAMEAISEYRPVAEAIVAFWSAPDHRSNKTWTDHMDINAVMLATSLAPEGFAVLAGASGS